MTKKLVQYIEVTEEELSLAEEEFTYITGMTPAEAQEIIRQAAEHTCLNQD